MHAKTLGFHETEEYRDSLAITGRDGKKDELYVA